MTEVYKPATDVEVEEGDGSTFVRLKDSSTWFVLEGTAKAIWIAIDSTDDDRSASTVTNVLLETYRADSKQVQRDVEDTLQEWSRLGLIEARSDG